MRAGVKQFNSQITAMIRISPRIGPISEPIAHVTEETRHCLVHQAQDHRVTHLVIMQDHQEELSESHICKILPLRKYFRVKQLEKELRRLLLMKLLYQKMILTSGVENSGVIIFL